MKRDVYRQAFIVWLAVTLLLGLGGLAVRCLTPYALARVTALLPTLDLSGLSTLCISLSTWTFAAAALSALLGAVVWAVRHKLHRGVKYALRHAAIVANIRKKLLETEGTYSIRAGSDLVSIPRVKLTLEGDDLTRGTVTLSNHIKFDGALSKLNLSPALGRYVVTGQYAANDGNAWVYEIEDFESVCKQLTFASMDEVREFTAKAKPYHLWAGCRDTVPLTGMALCGVTGSGKSYAVYFLLLQLLCWEQRPTIYYVDCKGGGLSVAGAMLAPERTADTVSDAVELVERFHGELERRKYELQEKLKSRLDADYSAWGMPPILLIFEEYAAFAMGLEKKEAEKITRMLRDVVLMGRQCGVFLWIILQKSDSTTLPTQLRDNLPLKICLGKAPKTTYITLFEEVPEIAERKFKRGEGVYTLHEDMPVPLAFPKLGFKVEDVLPELADSNSTATAPPPCEA